MNGSKLPSERGEFLVLFQQLKEFFMSLIDLKEGLDREGTILYIKNNKKVTGANAWLLMCSIMIASLGLELGSPAIIIGGMLISPLMSPILGIGLSFAINDQKGLSIALRHFSYMIAIALVTSTLYFWITPLENFNNEIASRTRPDVRDSLVALFGGLAGIISVTRKDMSNAIPGVAIATALMPPLCVAGYGLANWNFTVFQGAFYLFFLNSFFIALSTYLIVRLLGFEVLRSQNEKERKRANLLITILGALIFIPSIYLVRGVIKDERFEASAKSFVEANFEYEETVLSYKAVPEDSIIIIRVLGEEIERQDYLKLQNSLNELPAHQNTFLKIIQEANPGTEELALLRKEYSDVNFKLQSFQNDYNKQVDLVEQLKEKLYSGTVDSTTLTGVKNELKVLFPSLETLRMGSVQNSQKEPAPVVFVEWTKEDEEDDFDFERRRVQSFLRLRLQQDSLVVIPWR